MAKTEQDEEFAEDANSLNELKELTSQYLQDGGRVTHCLAFQESDKIVLIEPKNRRGRWPAKKSIPECWKEKEDKSEDETDF